MASDRFLWSTSSVVPASPAPVLGEQVTNTLRRMIIAGEIPVGTHLVEASLSEMFGLSRGPIRDALNKLELEGLVESRKRGVFVLGITAADIEELYVLRETLESKAIEICINTEDADLSEMKSILEMMRTAADSADSSSYSELDLEFHTGFYKLAGNRRMLEVWAHYRPTYAVMMSVAERKEVDLSIVHESHVRIVQLIEEKQTAKALVEIKNHLLESKVRILEARSLR